MSILTDEYAKVKGFGQSMLIGIFLFHENHSKLLAITLWPAGRLSVALSSSKRQ